MTQADVTLFAQHGDPDDTAMFDRATAAARRVYVPSGTYLLNSANWPSGTEIFGDGDATILKMVGASGSVFTNNSGSSDIAGNIRNLYMHDLQLLATCDTDGFSQFKHLVALNGVSNVTFERVLFRGFRGDGAYIGAGDVGAYRYNEDVTFRKCRFDGLNSENRNAVSFIDIDGALIEDCVFSDCTKSTMPGAIDFEPNANPAARIKNVTVRNNKFTNIGGNVAVIGMFVPATATEAPSNITVENNHADTFTKAFFSAKTARLPTDVSDENNYRLVGNSVNNGNRGYEILDGKRIIIRDNLFTDMAQSTLLGYIGATDAVRDVSVLNNRFVRCGFAGGNGFSVFAAIHMDIVGNKWIDCGTGVPGTSNAIQFHTGTSSHVAIEGNEVSAPTSKTLVAVVKEAGHTFTPATNRFRDNKFSALPNNFQAYIGDKFTASKAFNPGSLANDIAETTTVTLAGIELGDYVRAAFSLDLGGILLTAYVSAPDTVTCRFQNETGGVVDLGSGTLRVRGEKQALL